MIVHEMSVPRVVFSFLVVLSLTLGFTRPAFALEAWAEAWSGDQIGDNASGPTRDPDAGATSVRAQNDRSSPGGDAFAEAVAEGVNSNTGYRGSASAEKWVRNNVSNAFAYARADVSGTPLTITGDPNEVVSVFVFLQGTLDASEVPGGFPVGAFDATFDFMASIDGDSIVTGGATLRHNGQTSGLTPTGFLQTLPNAFIVDPVGNETNVTINDVLVPVGNVTLRGGEVTIDFGTYLFAGVGADSTNAVPNREDQLEQADQSVRDDYPLDEQRGASVNVSLVSRVIRPACVPLRPNGALNDGAPSLIYDANTGEVAFEAPLGGIAAMMIESVNGILPVEPDLKFDGGGYHSEKDGTAIRVHLSQATDFLSLGNLLPAGLPEQFILHEIMASRASIPIQCPEGSTDLACTSDFGRIVTDLIYVPIGESATDSVPDQENMAVIYNPTTGEVAVDVSENVRLISVNIDSRVGIFTGDPALNLVGSPDIDDNHKIFKLSNEFGFGSLTFGNVAQTRLSKDFILEDLRAYGVLVGGDVITDVEFVYVPEPAGLGLFVAGLFWLAVCKRCRSIGLIGHPQSGSTKNRVARRARPPEPGRV